MKDLLYDYFAASSSDISATKVVEILFLALILSMLMFFTYKISFSGVMYNRKFNISLVMITMVTTMVLIVIGGDISLSLGMVGALSIIRFRTAIKDPRDSGYIFWSIAIGISTGTQNYTIALVGSTFIAIVLTFFKVGKLTEENRYLIIIRAEIESEEDIIACIFNNFHNSQLRAKNSTEDNIEIVYQIKLKKNNDKNIFKSLYEIEGVQTVNLIAQNGETVG